MPGGELPSVDRIARALALAAWRMDELVHWGTRPDAVLAGEVPIRSRWVALVGLLALNPGLRADDIGPWIGAREPADGLRLAMLSPWWESKRAELLVVDVILHEERAPRHHPIAAFLGPIANAVRERADLLQRTAHDQH